MPKASKISDKHCSKCTCGCGRNVCCRTDLRHNQAKGPVHIQAAALEQRRKLLGLATFAPLPSQFHVVCTSSSPPIIFTHADMGDFSDNPLPIHYAVVSEPPADEAINSISDPEDHLAAAMKNVDVQMSANLLHKTTIEEVTDNEEEGDPFFGHNGYKATGDEGKDDLEGPASSDDELDILDESFEQQLTHFSTLKSL